MNKKKKLFSAIVLVLGIFGIILGSMINSNNYKSKNESDNDNNEIAASVNINSCKKKRYIRVNQNTTVNSPKSTKCDNLYYETEANIDGYNCTKSSPDKNGKYTLYKWVYSSCVETNTTTATKVYFYTIVDQGNMGYTIDGEKYYGSKTIKSTKARVRFVVGGTPSNYQYLTWTQSGCSYVSNTSLKSGDIFEGSKTYVCAKLKTTTTSTTTTRTTTRTTTTTTTTTREKFARAYNQNPGKISISCQSATAGACEGTTRCNVSNGGKCIFTATAINGYVVSRHSDCTYASESLKDIVSSEKTIDYYACPKNSQGSEKTSTCKINLTVNSGEAYSIFDGGKFVFSSVNSTSYDCKSQECYAQITSFSDSNKYKGLAGDGDCSTGVRTTGTKIYCTNNSVSVKACYNSSGSSSGGTYTPIPEQPVEDNKTVTKNQFFYASGTQYQGNSIKCGDKVYVTTCTAGENAICNVASINEVSVSTTTQIYEKDLVASEKDTGCYQKIERYISKKTNYYSDRELSKNATEIGCGSIVTFKQEIKNACVNKSCEVEYNGKTVYINIDYITSDKPACQNQSTGGENTGGSTSSDTNTCVTSKSLTGVKGDITVSICKKDDTEDTKNKIVTCAEDYTYQYRLTKDTCKDSNSENCYKEYIYTCNYIKRPGINASAGTIKSNGKGTITVTGVPYGNIGILGYHVSNGEEPTVNSGWSTFNAVNNTFSIERSAGTYFIWAINNKRRISYPVLAKVYDSDLSTTLSSFGLKDENGNDINVTMNSLDNTIGYNEPVKDSNYALLTNNLLADSIGGFDKLTTSYELSVTSNKIAIYATLTSSDATYVSGYEPRTIDLEYGRNVALIKIVNKNGKERCYTFIINRVDDRNSSNLLKNIKLSRGSIDFDPYTTNYDVKISRFTKKVSINAELDSSTSTFISGYEPREVEITEDRQSVVLKVISETGSIRSYVITFIRNGEDKDNVNSTYLSSLTVPGTMLGFDKETYDYTITVPYETEDIPVYAFAEDENATVNVGNNTGLKVGNNLIQIEVKNNNKTRIYSLHVIRKESGLDISNSARLGTLSIKNYNIEFNPDKLDYEVKIKREKTLLISATPESNRADIYMYGNNDLTGFSTVRVKVIAENGLTNIYSIDIQKDAYNKKIEIIASVAGVSTVIIVGVIVYLKNKHNKRKEYLEG